MTSDDHIDSTQDPELDRWNARFAASEYVFGTEPNAFLARQKPLLRSGMSALCVADGQGRNSVWLARQGLRVTAFDFSPVGIEKARALAEQAAVTVDYRHANATDWKWEPAAYDVVVAIFVQFAGPRLREKMFAGMVRTLRSGGFLILQGYGPKQLDYGTGGPKILANLYTEDLLRQSFAGLEILHLQAHDDVMHEGPGHDGMSALVDLVARKP
jgi:SAM-dependent methyltransferase